MSAHTLSIINCMMSVSYIMNHCWSPTIYVSQSTKYRAFIISRLDIQYRYNVTGNPKFPVSSTQLHLEQERKSISIIQSINSTFKPLQIIEVNVDIIVITVYLYNVKDKKHKCPSTCMSGQIMCISSNFKTK